MRTVLLCRRFAKNVKDGARPLGTKYSLFSLGIREEEMS